MASVSHNSRGFASHKVLQNICVHIFGTQMAKKNNLLVYRIRLLSIHVGFENNLNPIKHLHFDSEERHCWINTKVKSHLCGRML